MNPSLPTPPRKIALLLVGAAHCLLIFALLQNLQRSAPGVLPMSVSATLIMPAPVSPEPLVRMQPAKPASSAVVRNDMPVVADVAPVMPASNAAVPAVSEPSPPARQAEPASEPAPPPPVVPPRSDAAQLNNPAPAYPALSRRLGEEGRVLLQVYILADGRVGEVRLKASSGWPRLDQAAIDAVRRWRYLPARQGDVAIPYWYVQPVDFSLNG